MPHRQRGLSVHYDVGWHITGTAGVFGAAAAVGESAWTECTADDVGARHCGDAVGRDLREMFGTMCKPFHPGRAAQNGMRPLSSRRRISPARNAHRSDARLRAMCSRPRVTMTKSPANLGQTWEVALNSYKPFACGIVIHPTIDACVQLRNEHKLTAADQIEGVALKVHPLVLELTGKKTPQVGLEGKFSVYHSAAVAIIHGEGGEAFTAMRGARSRGDRAARQGEREIDTKRARRRRVHFAIRLKDGRVPDKHVEHAIGSLARPMSDADLEAKFRGARES